MGIHGFKMYIEMWNYYYKYSYTVNMKLQLPEIRVSLHLETKQVTVFALGALWCLKMLPT